MKTKILLAILFVFVLGSFVSADQPIDPNDSFIRDKMIMNLSELSGFTFGGTWFSPDSIHSYYHIDLRYYSPVDNDQHSEYLLEIFNTSAEAENHFNSVLPSSDLYTVSLKVVNGNEIYEGISKLPPTNGRMLVWISENKVIWAWNGNDVGSVVDDVLFNTLTNAYLTKYPSTHECTEGNISGECITNPPSCTDECSVNGQKRCEGNNSQICGSWDVDECLEWNFGMICPYGCSSGICNYILEEQENGTIFYITPNVTSGPIEMPKENNLITQNSVICQGCELEKKCYPYGYRKDSKFCSDSISQFVEQKQADSSCENSFECSTNLCIDTQCVSSGFWQKILAWFKKLFGG